MISLYLNVSIRVMLWGVISLMMRIYYDKMITNTFSILSLFSCHLICPFHFEVFGWEYLRSLQGFTSWNSNLRGKQKGVRVRLLPRSERCVHYSEHLLILGHNVCLKKKKNLALNVISCSAVSYEKKQKSNNLWVKFSKCLSFSVDKLQ